MLALRSILRNNQQIFKAVAQQQRNNSIAVPSRNKVSTAEMIVLASLMVIGWTAVPAYVLVNIKHYRDKDN